MLGSYGQSNIDARSGWVLVGKDYSGTILTPPSEYILVLDTTSLAIDQDGAVYVWQPIPREGYTAVGNVITRCPDKPPLDKIRCVRSDFVVLEENGEWIWGAEDESISFNVYSSTKNGGSSSILVQTGLFLVQDNRSPLVSYLMNVAETLSAMPNMKEIEELIEEISPVIYFHPDEQFFPCSVSWFFENGGLLYAKGKESEPVLVNKTGSNLPQSGSNDGLYWLDLPINDGAKDEVKRGNVQGATVYAHIKPALGATCTDIVIWIFYPYNGPSKARVGLIDIDLGKFGEHVGDWEHVTLRVSNFDKELKSVFFSQHNRGVWLDGSEMEYQNGKKPVVYSSLHGHAAFPKAGMNVKGDAVLGIRNDAGRGMRMDTGFNYSIVSADYLKHEIVEPCWLNCARQWGPKSSYDYTEEMEKLMKVLPDKLKSKFMHLFNSLPDAVLGQEGPTGPKYKYSWYGDE